MAEEYRDLAEWADATLYRHSIKRYTPQKERYRYFAVAHDYDSGRMMAVYPLEEDGSLPADYWWRPLEEYDIQLDLFETYRSIREG